MYKTIKVYIDEKHCVRSLDNIELPAGKTALMTILDQDEQDTGLDTAILSESVLAKDWNRVEEDRAWSSLQ